SVCRDDAIRARLGAVGSPHAAIVRSAFDHAGFATEDLDFGPLGRDVVFVPHFDVEFALTFFGLQMQVMCTDRWREKQEPRDGGQHQETESAHKLSPGFLSGVRPLHATGGYRTDPGGYGTGLCSVEVMRTAQAAQRIA